VEECDRRESEVGWALLGAGAVEVREMQVGEEGASNRSKARVVGSWKGEEGAARRRGA
jgi:hypothetical protein